MAKNHTRLISIFSAIFIGLITILAFIIFGSLSNSFSNSQPTPIPTSSPTPGASLPPQITGCANLVGDDLQQCCNQWAIDNQTATIQCVGRWQTQGEVCNYVCDTQTNIQ